MRNRRIRPVAAYRALCSVNLQLTIRRGGRGSLSEIGVPPICERSFVVFFLEITGWSTENPLKSSKYRRITKQRPGERKRKSWKILRITKWNLSLLTFWVWPYIYVSITEDRKLHLFGCQEMISAESSKTCAVACSCLRLPYTINDILHICASSSILCRRPKFV
jgi:hypothetical protein